MKNKVLATLALLLTASLPLAAASKGAATPKGAATLKPAATPGAVPAASPTPKTAAASPAPKPTPKAATKPAADGSPALDEKVMRDALNSSSEGAAPLTILRENKSKNGAPPPGGVPTSGTTEVTSDVGAFDQKAHVAIFTKNVYVESPQFTVTCEKLTAYMHQGPTTPTAAAPGATPAAATPAPTPAATPDPKTAANGAAPAADAEAKPKSGGLEKAVCEGTVVIIQDKIDPDGTLTRNTGHAQKAVYHADSGDIYLFGNPDVQQGLNTVTSLEDSTVMILNRDGHMTINGLHRSVIKDSGASNSDNGKD